MNDYPPPLRDTYPRPRRNGIGRSLVLVVAFAFVFGDGVLIGWFLFRSPLSPPPAGAPVAAVMNTPSAQPMSTRASISVSPSSEPSSAATAAVTFAASPLEETPAAPDGYKLVTAAGFGVALPRDWIASLNPEPKTLLHAESPLGGTKFNVYKDTLDGKTLRQYFGEQTNLIGDLWKAKIVTSETIVGAVPALRGDALQTFLVTQSHVMYDIEEPPGSGVVYELALDTDGTAIDPALDTIISSFAFAQ